MPVDISTLVAVAALLLNIGVALVGATWGLGKIRLTVANEMEQHRTLFDGKLERSERSIGETVAAIRQKIHEVEMWARDQLEPKGASEAALARYAALVSDQFDKIDRRLERMESKIDKASAAAMSRD